MTELPYAPAEEVADLLLRIYETHEVIIAETGGLPGLRGINLLRTAAARPYATFGGEELHASDFDKAAALFHSVIRGHTIPDELPRREVIQFCIEVAEVGARQVRGEAVMPKTVEQIAAWLRQLLGVSAITGESPSEA